MANTFVQRINDNFPAFSKSEKRLANFLMTNPDSLMAESTATLGNRVGVSAMTVSRFIRKIGFDSYAEAKLFVKEQVFGPDVLVGHTIEERYRLYAENRKKVAGGTDNLSSEIAALRQVYEMRKGEAWARVVERIATADNVYVAGFQATRHLAIGLAAQMEYVRPHVFFMDGLNGTYIQALGDPADRIAVVILDTHPYARAAPELAKRAVEAGRELIVICDEFCHWAREFTQDVLSAAANVGHLFRSTVALSAVTGLLTNDVIDFLGEPVLLRLKEIAEARTGFGQYIY